MLPDSAGSSRKTNKAAVQHTLSKRIQAQISSALLCREAVIGLVLVKELVLIDMFANIPVSALSMRPIPQLRADTAMYDLLKLFQTGRTHMVLLTRPPAGAKLLAAQAAGSASSWADLAVNIEPHTIKRAAEEVGPNNIPFVHHDLAFVG